MTRALAHIEVVSSISPIENADRIEVVTVLGWHCVTKKNEVSVGDLVVYFEIDSFLPIDHRFEFLRASSFKKMSIDDGNGLVITLEGFRLRTVQLRGQISQGLVMPINLFPELPHNFVEGQDVTEILGVRLYEPFIPANMRALIKGDFPYQIKRTDQERIQNHPEYFIEYKNVEFEVTEKEDGTSATFFVDDDENLNACSHNKNLHESDSIYWEVVEKYDLKSVFKQIGSDYAIQGEIIGEGVEKNKLNVKGRRLLIFDVWSISKQRYLTSNERMNLLDEFFINNRLEHVPVISKKMQPFLQFSNIDELIAYANGTSLTNTSRNREGLVFKSCDLIDGQTLTFKIVDNKQLLKETD